MVRSKLFVLCSFMILLGYENRLCPSLNWRPNLMTLKPQMLRIMRMETVMKRTIKLIIGLIALSIPTLACADLLYDPDKEQELNNMQAIETASVNMQYQCAKYSLLISAYATQSEINGLDASITGKIVSSNTAHDISADLTKAISRHNFLTGKMSVSCNKTTGAFQIKFTPNEFDNQKYVRTSVSIFADGTVWGSRTIKKRTAFPKKNHG